MLVELLLVPQCRYAEHTRAVLLRCLTDAGLAVPVVERVGDYPSPTVLVNGVDVTTGAAGVRNVPACRLDLPTPQQVLAALQAQAATAPQRHEDPL